MPFAFTDGPEIGKPKTILKGVMGAREILGKVKGQVYLYEVRQWAGKKSVTAQRISRRLTGPPSRFTSSPWTEASHASTTSRPPAG